MSCLPFLRQDEKARPTKLKRLSAACKARVYKFPRALPFGTQAKQVEAAPRLAVVKPVLEGPVRPFDRTNAGGVGSYNKKPATRGVAPPRVVAKFAFYPRRARQSIQSFAGTPSELRVNK